MLRITEIVKNLIIINIIVYFSVKYLIPIPGIERYFTLVSPGQEFNVNGIIYTFEPLQLITHMFMHGSEMHLLFNMLGLYFLGPWVESSLGPKRFFILYMSCGLFASLAQMLFSGGMMVGASGATYGVLAAFATMFPNIKLMLLFPPIPIKAKYMAIGLIGLGLYYGFSGTQQGIGHFAHIGGAILGFLMIRYWKMQNLQ
ncbi:MAG TPA: rhomboid family intramembrane serine protease [Saprospiraceae bacterium]|nr:rhomboid family intramembrane serine protease [Saprospiraceae bacterium]HRO08082.1 rhomboid family intramembrane serine protease [Saprospiraceae bacterium]HRO72272.1 rhomboid family intramembrane serine protease [Saprospiraceae bacterium]HRP41331.1 rhomboid family intramembrane serine protease [Saprospiraceae bacterium]